MASESKDAVGLPTTRTILIVDDIPDNLTVLSVVLREQGYEVRPVRNGRLALQAARRELPDLVLLDILMPEMDGYEVCRQFKADPALKSVPIIFISAANDTEVKVRAFTSGGVDFISKPFAPAEVLARVHTHLTVRSVERALERRVHEHEQRYRAMFEGCKVPELLIDPVDGRIIDVNSAAERYYGWSKARLTAMNIGEINILTGDVLAVEMARAQTGMRDYFHFRHRLATGEVRDVEVYCGPVMVNDRQLLYSLVHDITERRRAEAALALNRELLDCISRMQARFISEADSYGAFEGALADILKLTGSRYGFLAEWVAQPDGSRHQQTAVVAGPDGDKMFRRSGEPFASCGDPFAAFDWLDTAILDAKAPVIVNNPAHHLTGWGLPPGHPGPACLLGLPMSRGDAVIGSIGLANRAGGYDRDIVDFIQPAIVAISQILNAHYEQRERRQAVQALAESESRYRGLVDTQVDMVVRFDLNGFISFVNNTVCDRVCVPRSDLIGQLWTCLVDPEDQAAMADGLEAARAHPPDSGVVEARFSGCCGMRWYSWEVSGITNADQSLSEIQAIGRDITQRKRADDDRRDQVLFLQSLIEAIPAAVFYKNVQGIYLGGNRIFADLIGRPLDQIIGFSIDKLVPEDVSAIFRASDQRVYQTRGADIYDFIKHWGSDEGRHLRACKAPYDRADGSFGGVIGIVLDITADIRREADLRQAKLAAEQASRAKSAFVANMSHEIRTPMNAILGLLYLVGQTELTAVQNDYIAKASASAQSLLGILNDILDFSKIEADRLELERIPFRLDELLKTLETISRANARDKDLEVLFTLAPQTPFVLIGDPLRLQQILMNLLSNAIKFTRRGKVELSVRPDRITDGAVSLTFAVRDTGIGINADQRRHIFEAFSQGESGTSRRYGGSGLGLAIVKRLVTLMGGEIAVDSALGMGSVFHFTVGFDRVLAADCDRIPTVSETPKPDTGKPVAGLSLLLVEDNKINQMIGRRILEKAGATVEVAADGVQAVKILTAAPARFDLVLMDIQMPEMDGYETTLCIRKQLGLTALPIVAMTANALSSDRDNCLAVGMNDHVSKPLEIDLLMATILRWVRAGNKH